MKGMIFAAGLGTRLRPLTNDRPKALVEVEGRSLLELQLLRLRVAGVREVVINIHHFADKMLAAIEALAHLGMDLVVSDEREQVLETGGGLKKAADLLRGYEPILLCNVDVLTDLDIAEFKSAHERSGALATLAVRDRQTSRYLLFDKRLELCGWKNEKTGEIRMAREVENVPQKLAFSGLQLIRPEMLDLIKEEGVFSIIDVYLRLAQQHRVGGYRHDEGLWLDVGKPATLAKAGRVLGALNLD